MHLGQLTFTGGIDFIGFAAILIATFVWPAVAYNRYAHEHSNDKKVLFIKVILLTICAIAGILLVILALTSVIFTKNLAILVIACYDAQILVNWWTPTREVWHKRREKRYHLIGLAILSIFLTAVLIEIFYSNL